ncbi:MAG: 30S ribosomal protein S6 [Endomicrobium sp.]|jgi:small subunit ribosomal protein S6|nr:30S ribosomal protein S6 [Endomicrobium sp.]
MNYESIFIISPDLQAEKIGEIIAKATKNIEISKGVVRAVQQLGKRKLAYIINGFYDGNYIRIEFSGNKETINTLENFFKFNDFVLRFLTIKIENNKFTKQMSKITQAAEEKNNESTTEQQSSFT